RSHPPLLSLHDALPIFAHAERVRHFQSDGKLRFADDCGLHDFGYERNVCEYGYLHHSGLAVRQRHLRSSYASLAELLRYSADPRSEEHTSELQSRFDLV